MILQERIRELEALFNVLEYTSSRNAKEALIERLRLKDEQLGKDLTYALEILDGRHKLGYTFLRVNQGVQDYRPGTEISLEEYLSPLYRLKDHGVKSVTEACAIYYANRNFLFNLLNRVYRLGIGKSQLEKTAVSPMLAKKYEPDKVKDSKSGYYLTEKLDGNRCLCQFVAGEWTFTSRSGKPLKVKFNMRNLPTEYIYDGEVLSREQIENPSQGNFNATSGQINSKNGSKEDLVYVIFDIPNLELTYAQRRAVLDRLIPTGHNVQILPLLAVVEKDMLHEATMCYLEQITEDGGEGVMINLGDAKYQQKRTDALLKVKKVQTMDMEVVELTEGTGRHMGVVGALCCRAVDPETGCIYECRVGSGLSDYDRTHWADKPEHILGKIVEVAYFSISQDAEARGSKRYSLRFPRYIKIRRDKGETSVH